eukprot:6204002-Pleurochrysis_carterae.AAC.1
MFDILNGIFDNVREKYVSLRTDIDDILDQHAKYMKTRGEHLMQRKLLKAPGEGSLQLKHTLGKKIYEIVRGHYVLRSMRDKIILSSFPKNASSIIQMVNQKDADNLMNVTAEAGGSENDQAETQVHRKRKL